MPDLSHLWQRFVRATALLFGLAVGVAGTVFAYSNTRSVDIGWSVFHLDGIPLWAVVIVPLVIVLAAGTLYHWYNSLHHFTEHMRHRRRVHELEAEVTTLRTHLDKLLEMPDHASTGKAPALAEPEVKPALPEPAASNGGDRPPTRARKRGAAAVLAETAPVVEASPAEPTAEDDPALAGEEPREETTAQA